MSSFRIDRISEEVRHAVDAAIRTLNDPRVCGTYCVTRADVTRDLRYAKVYVSVLEDDKAEDLIKALKNAAGYLRREVGRQVDLRYTPELLFERDPRRLPGSIRGNVPAARRNRARIVVPALSQRAAQG